MNQITGWGWYWLIWFFGGFGIAESYGLIWNAKDTLSWQFWGLEHEDFGHPLDFANWTPLHYAIGCVLLISFIWLFGHLVFGVWRG